MYYLSNFKKMYDLAIMSEKEDGIFSFSSHYRKSYAVAILSGGI